MLLQMRLLLGLLQDSNTRVICSRKNVTDRLIAVRETGVSRHQGGPIEGPPESPRTSQHYRILNFQRGVWREVFLSLSVWTLNSYTNLYYGKVIKVMTSNAPFWHSFRCWWVYEIPHLFLPTSYIISVVPTLQCRGDPPSGKMIRDTRKTVNCCHVDSSRKKNLKDQKRWKHFVW